MGLVLAVKVLNNPRADRICLSGIDCPDRGQAFGKRAKQAASELAYGKEVTLQTFGKGKYHRTIADVILPDGTNVNHALVKEGWCWWYRKYAPGDTRLERLGVCGKTIMARWKFNGPHIWTTGEYSAGCSKRPSSKASASEEAKAYASVR